ncbi:MAG: hypothetical protein AAFO75_14380 [Pseudomonadota bacterium]
MSLSRGEFDKSLAAFTATTGYKALTPDTHKTPEVFPFEIGGGTAIVGYQELASATFGGLLQLPRAEVTISFDDVADSLQKEFLAAFDIAFQRGGG